MKKVLLLVLLLVVAAGISACKKEDKKQVDTSVTQESESETYEGTIFDLIKKKKTMKCTFSYSEQGQQMSGVVYIDNEKSRSDFEMIQTGQTKIDGHSITDGTWVYNWSSLTKDGTKMKIEEVEPQSSQAQDGQKGDQSAAPAQKIKYDCNKWKADESMFIPPSDIIFMDMSQIIENAMEGFKNISPELDMCDACDDMPKEEDRESCRKMLKCDE